MNVVINRREFLATAAGATCVFALAFGRPVRNGHNGLKARQETTAVRFEMAPDGCVMMHAGDMSVVIVS